MTGPGSLGWKKQAEFEHSVQACGSYLFLLPVGVTPVVEASGAVGLRPCRPRQSWGRAGVSSSDGPRS